MGAGFGVADIRGLEIEFLTVSFILGGLNLNSVTWITLIVNFRHVFHGLTFPITRLSNMMQCAHGIFALTDEKRFPYRLIGWDAANPGAIFAIKDPARNYGFDALR